VPLINVTQAEVISVQASGGTITINTISFSDATNDIVPAGFTLVVYATDVKSDGFTSPKNSDFRYLTSIAAGVDANTVGLAGFYNSVFGNSWLAGTNTDAKIWFGFKMVAVATGQRSNSYLMNQSNVDAT
jgi:hypothetical protein